MAENAASTTPTPPAAPPPAAPTETRSSDERIAEIVARALAGSALINDLRAGVDALQASATTGTKALDVLADAERPPETEARAAATGVQWNAGISVAVRDTTLHTRQGYEPERQRQAFPGQRFVQLVHCLKDSQRSIGSPRPMTPAQVATTIFGERHPVTQLAAWSPPETRDITSTSATSAGILIPPGIAMEVTELMRPKSVVLASGPQVISNPTGRLPIPSQDQGATASYLAENEAVQLSQAGFKMEYAVSKRLAAGTLVSLSWMRRVDDGTYQLVLRDLLNALALTMDQALLRSTGANGQPKGLRHWAHPDNVFACSNPVGGDTPAEVLAKIQATYNSLILPVIQADIPIDSGHFFMAPRTSMFLAGVVDGNGNFPYRTELAAGKWGMFPVSWTTSLPVDLDTGTGGESEIIFANMNDFVYADEEQVRVKTSTEVYEMGGVAQSAVQRDMQLITVTAHHDFVALRTKAASVAKGCTWGVPV